MSEEKYEANRVLRFTSNKETCDLFESVLFYLNISKQEILNEEYGNLGSPNIASIADCINLMRAANVLLDGDFLPSNTEYDVIQWMNVNPEKYNKIV